MGLLGFRKWGCLRSHDRYNPALPMWAPSPTRGGCGLTPCSLTQPTRVLPAVPLPPLQDCLNNLANHQTFICPMCRCGPV